MRTLQRIADTVQHFGIGLFELHTEIGAFARRLSRIRQNYDFRQGPGQLSI